MKPYNHKLLNVLLLTVVFLMASCYGTKDLPKVAETALPTKYTMKTSDTGAVDVIEWKKYFKDANLVSLLDIAIQNNIELQISNQRNYAARAQFIMSRNAMLPTIHASVSTGVTRFGDYTIDGVGNFDTNKSLNINQNQRIPNPVPDYMLGLNSSWEMSFAGKLRNRKRAAFERYLANEEGIRFLTTQLVADVARLYYELLALDTELEIIRKNIAIQEKAYEIVEIQKQSGRINELAVKQFQAQLLKFKALEGEISMQITTHENNLNALVGRYPQRIARKDTIDIKDLPVLLQIGTPSSLLKNRPDVKRAEKDFLASQHELKSARAAFYPNLTLNAGIGLNAFKSELLFNTPASLAYTALAGITNPLINRNQIKYSYTLAATEQHVAFLNFQQTLYRAVGEVQTEYVRYQNYKNISQLKLEEVTALKQAVDISNELFVTGYANYMEVLMSRQNRLESELQLTAARKEQFVAAINLYKALGGGWK